MQKSFRSHLTFANVASALALFLAIGGGGAIAAGAIGGGDGTIKACYVKKGNPRRGTSTGEVRLLLKRTKCSEGEQAFSFNARGAQGPAGLPGAQGVPGPQGTPGANGTARAYGSVSAEGVVDTTESTPGIKVAHEEAGHYCIDVPGITQASAVIVPVMDFDYSSAGDTAANWNSGCGGFGVATFDAAGTQHDAGFDFVIP